MTQATHQPVASLQLKKQAPGQACQQVSPKDLHEALFGESMGFQAPTPLIAGEPFQKKALAPNR
jgi:hypothetical protein